MRKWENDLLTKQVVEQKGWRASRYLGTVRRLLKEEKCISCLNLI